MLNMTTVDLVNAATVELPVLYVFVLHNGKTKQYVPKATLESGVHRLVRRHADDAQALVVYYRCGCVRKYYDGDKVAHAVDCWLSE